MGIGRRITASIDHYRTWRRGHARGAIGDYYRNGGNELLYRGLPVSSADIVLDVGGYAGEWTAELQARYGCSSVVFEPVPAFQRALRQRFGRNDRVTLVDAGLGAKAGRSSLWLAADGSSVVRRATGNATEVPIVGVAEAFAEFGGPGVACMKVNIEGAEYEVLEQILALGLQSRVRCFLIQFHDFAKGSRARRAAFQSRIADSHRCEFDYPFVWEKWTEKSQTP